MLLYLIRPTDAQRGGILFDMTQTLQGLRRVASFCAAAQQVAGVAAVYGQESDARSAVVCRASYLNC